MHIFKLNKLIRDNILQHMKSDDFRLNMEVLNNESFIDSLQEKLIEESIEVKNTTNNLELIDELADVLEVVDSLLSAKGITMQQIVSQKEKKRLERGGFDGKNKVHTIELSSEKIAHHKWIDYFSQSPEKYPEIIK